MDGRTNGFSKNEHGSLTQQGGICVPKVKVKSSFSLVSSQVSS